MRTHGDARLKKNTNNNEFMKMSKESGNTSIFVCLPRV